jgi:hypothetical protein
LDLFEDANGGSFPYDPIAVGTTSMGRNTPALYKFEGDIRTTGPWAPLPPPTPYIPVNGSCHPNDAFLIMSSPTTAASNTGFNTSSTFSKTDEREHSKDQMTNLKVSLLPTSGKALCEWVLTLKWSLAGNCWCHGS